MALDVKKKKTEKSINKLLLARIKKLINRIMTSRKEDNGTIYIYAVIAV